EVVPLPEDGELRAMLAASQIVVCKSGFQQMVESLAVGAPVLAVAAAGSVPEVWLDPVLRRFIRYLPAPGDRWGRSLLAAAAWLGARPEMPWTETLTRIADPAASSAELLLGVLCRRAVRA
ncbi:MAG TPA: hypothetical protein VHG28_18305, partial [Longimicrobiaceae bacterium]|nr:hypothetical protein [Longimicrobiaceae bacterium]